MNITAVSISELDESVDCLAAAFANDPITGFLLQSGPGYRDRVAQFFSLLMRARIALEMPVVVARDSSGIHGAAMGYSTAHSAWPKELAEEWDRFESSIPGMADRMAIYDDVAAKFKPPVPHYYLGVIGVDPGMQGRGIGAQLLRSFCDLSRKDPLSCGVYLETAEESNLAFYERAGFVETGRGPLGSAALWCMYLSQARDGA